MPDARGIEDAELVELPGGDSSRDGLLPSRPLSRKESQFCELYVNAPYPYGGDAARCYADLFGGGADSRVGAMRLLARPEIKAAVERLEVASEASWRSRRTYLFRRLESLIDETSTATYTDRKGNPLSPASMRGVAVSALKLYAEVAGVRNANPDRGEPDRGGGQVNVSGDGASITFNVIVPDALKKKIGKNG